MISCLRVEWQPDQIRWYVDDRQSSRLPRPDPGWYPIGFMTIRSYHPEPGGWLAGWPGYPDSTTVFPQQLQVDYVRVYQKPGQTTPTP